ncbi:hypothetical protein ACJMK2_023121 [Sinanodonta woodiana]|uniref:Fibronectin type-III domain-containing protein n=1 Tax=Sinanodonta woodiana TaxID=1069815 RepID=A0ABD3T3Z8_SINWO
MSQKPGKPRGVTSDDGNLLVSWDVSTPELDDVDFFEIQWKKKEEKRWSGLKCTDDNSTSIAIPRTDFENNKTYQLKVKWTTKNGDDSPFSEISDDVLIIASIQGSSPRQPGKIVLQLTTATSAYLAWEKPKGPDEVSIYEVKYRLCGDVQWLTANTKQSTENMDMKDLKSNSSYEFKVRAIFSDGSEGPFSEVSDTVKTHESLATQVKKGAKKIAATNPAKYKIPLTYSEKWTSKSAITRKLRFGERDQLHSTKTIMVVGATGAGKSTMIDGMINYIVNVAWEDDFRFTMIDLTEEEMARAGQQAISQTSCITCYEVNYQPGSRLNYHLNIIDTPGFGDTRGIQQDKKIVDQIREFFTAPGDQGITSISAVCFITQAPLARLTHTQKYIFDSILSVFGKDIKDNIFVLITFADGNEPPVLEALKEAKVPFKDDFKFNNSALFVSTGSSGQFAQMFWKLGTKSFDNFFTKLNGVNERSLKLTSEVLSARKQIENTIDRLKPQIETGLNKLTNMQHEAEVLEKHQKDIEDNQNFTYMSKQVHTREVPTKPGQYVTHCRVCNFSCHLNCSYNDDNDKIRCCAMSGGYCTVCERKCLWSNHKNYSFIVETYIIEKEETYTNLKGKYDSAKAGVQQQSTTLQKLRSEFKSVLVDVLQMLKTVRESINKLEKYALKLNPLNEVNYVNLLIESEKREAKIGWESRLKMLEEIKIKAELIRKISDASVQSSWTDQDVENFMKKLTQ